MSDAALRLFLTAMVAIKGVVFLLLAAEDTARGGGGAGFLGVVLVLLLGQRTALWWACRSRPWARS